jgi:hypothetical protein
MIVANWKFCVAALQQAEGLHQVAMTILQAGLTALRARRILSLQPASQSDSLP